MRSGRQQGRVFGSAGQRCRDLQRIAKTRRGGARERRRLAGASQDQKPLCRHAPTRARKPPWRSTIATSTAVFPHNVASATSRARRRHRAGQRLPPVAGDAEDFGGSVGGARCRRSAGARRQARRAARRAQGHRPGFSPNADRDGRRRAWRAWQIRRRSSAARPGWRRRYFKVPPTKSPISIKA